MRQGNYKGFPAHVELTSYDKHSGVQHLFCENRSKNPETNPLIANLSAGKGTQRTELNNILEHESRQHTLLSGAHEPGTSGQWNFAKN